MNNILIYLFYKYFIKYFYIMLNLKKISINIIYNYIANIQKK